MLVRTADAEWKGLLREGEGHMRLGTRAFEGRYTWNSRFSDGGGTNPEELIAAAHAGCFSMALAGDLGNAGFKPEYIRTTANLQLDRVDGKWTITQIDLTTGAKVAGVDKATFDKIAAQTLVNCPVSRALNVAKVTLDATLES